ncbi:hypothetical protein SAMN02745124_00379 [Desulfofustis glycolicus DSM 9705]|uniref:Uncharacterized protein n=1 Tax=Desulfofustis glycolicus DSM 9705 TaxID=1121409 RepID=A0A1M5SJA0_9BACT|nr:hypothetical protein SAMN02745124_00379 [Desulfofustis glycolicus DSM 9705]
MIVPDAFFPLIVALFISLIAGWFIRRGRSRRSFFWYFLIIFLVTVAAGGWLADPPWKTGADRRSVSSEPGLTKGDRQPPLLAEELLWNGCPAKNISRGWPAILPFGGNEPGTSV